MRNSGQNSEVKINTRSFIISAVSNQKVIPPRKCLFCQGYGMSGQHIWPDWMGKDSALPTFRKPNNAIGIFQTLNKFHHVISPKNIDNIVFIEPPKFINRQGYLGNQKLKIVCVKCNNTWMSQIELNSKSIIRSLMLNENRILSVADQDKLVAWITLMAIIAEFTDEPMKAISYAERKYFMDNKMPPRQWAIWIGKYEGVNWNQHFKHHGMAMVSPNGTAPELKINAEQKINIQTTTFAVGGFLFFVASTFEPALYKSIQKLGFLNLVKLWPYSPNEIDWSMMTINYDEQMENISNVILAAVGKISAR